MSDFTQPLEASTRKKIDQMLINLGWEVDEYSPKCNVFAERAKTLEQNKKFSGKQPDYVLYKSGVSNQLSSEIWLRVRSLRTYYY